MAMMPPPPEFSATLSRCPSVVGALSSMVACGLLGLGIVHLGALWNLGGPSSGARPPRLAALPHRFTLSVDLTEPSLQDKTWKPGKSGPGGGGLGTNTVDPALLSFTKVAVPSVDLDAVLPLSPREPLPTFAGEATLPLAPGGDGNPAGHGFGFGYGTGDGIGQGGGEWGVTKKVRAGYPPQALIKNIQGYVVVLVTVDEQGTPIKVKPIKGNDLLMAECLRVLMLWRFEQPAKYGLHAPVSFPVTHKFELVAAHMK